MHTLAIVLAAALGAQDWPNWRGPSHDGASDATGVPTEWGEGKNVKWKAPVPSWSGSSPIVTGDRVFVVSPTAAGSGPAAPQKRGMGGKRKPEGKDILLICYSKKTGKPLWQKPLANDNHHMGYQNMSSPSPVTDGKMVWGLTGTGVLTGFTVEGKPRWQVNLQKSFGKFGLGWGYASSPLLLGDRLIVQVLHGNDTDDPSYVVAFAAKSGKMLWRVERPTDALKESPDSFATPVPMIVGNRTEIIVGGGDYITSHDPKTGRELWRCGGLNLERVGNYRGVASPAVIGDLAIHCIRGGPTVACRTGGKGNVTETHKAWSEGFSYDVPTPVTDGKYLYTLKDNGVLSCYDPKTGKAVYDDGRLPNGTYRASPLLVDGKIYCTNQNALTTVVTAGPQFKVLSQNQLDDDYTLSSIAVSGKNLFIRTSQAVYCIGE